jgi:hypothetical protein
MLVNAKKKIPKHLLCFDPGETTGFERFVDGHLVWSEELKTHTIAPGTHIINPLIGTAYKLGSPVEVVVENYQVYKWKMKQHVGDTLHTARLIGCIETLCALYDIPLTKQLAQNAKKFATDEKLKAWDMYPKGQRHARDAIRHGILYILFNKGQVL